jgi:hypothetical protein
MLQHKWKQQEYNTISPPSLLLKINIASSGFLLGFPLDHEGRDGIFLRNF